jgi:pyrroline-5-carboxylate reductase
MQGQGTEHSDEQGRGRAEPGGRGAIAIIGAGNLGQALASGWLAAGLRRPEELILTRRSEEPLEAWADRGCRVTTDNAWAVGQAEVVVIAVQPQQILGVLEEIGGAIDVDRHVLISVVSDVPTGELRARLGLGAAVVRVMPNTAVGIRESMTCLAAPADAESALEVAQSLFDAVGRTLVIREELMTAATALCACGVAFFLRAVRAASQGGTEIGFHPEEALLLAAQTARGASSLVLAREAHPEREIDRVTTPRGCTIAGLNEMEHQGFSSAMIKGLLLSAEKAGKLYEG